ncbi:MAG: hypothetical protein IRY99_22980, partial [Isosphaeraceae bacterium]|nr:hypothetical protein [Isosphaeraceae bacterium]
PHTVRLRDGRTELARWEFAPHDFQLQLSPPFRLPAGLRVLTLESNREETPHRRRERATDGDPRPYSLRVAGISLTEAAGPEAAVAVGKHRDEARQ